MSRAKTLVVLLAIALTAGLARPSLATKYAGEFLKLPVGARAIGMGSAFVAVTDDATAPHWNPAGMVFLPYREVLFQHAERFGSLVNHDYISGVFPLGGEKNHEQAVGFSIVRLAVDDIPITPRAGDLRRSDFLDYGRDGQPFTYDPGEGNGVWDPGERLLLTADNLFLASSSDMAFTMTYAKQRGERWAFGGNLKFIRQSVPNTDAHYDTTARQVTDVSKATSFGAGLDAGVLWMPTDAITVGAVLKDLTTTYLAWSNGTHEDINPTLTTGASFNFFPAPRHAITLASDLAWGFENRQLDSQIKMGSVTADVRLGAEYWYRNLVAVRTGVDGKDLAIGTGIRYKQFGIDYAASLHRFFAADDSEFPDDQDLNTTHLVSLAVSW
jgi:hypothetical protein